MQGGPGVHTQELRQLAHVIDVTQLYDTPDLYRHRQEPSAGQARSSTRTISFIAPRCSARTATLRPSYTRGATGAPSCAASEVEMLAIAISTKHLAKAEAVRGMNKEIRERARKQGG